ncbi:hypothetical protein FHS15_001629 [Paenibacillus castaneae]|uniref:aminoglycoside phosphotransferase family protein n=1 Tax=Paenibacillus castaneae TaxID=474957 RepID=UPI000C9B190D|nr:aminoglycoside phosphotransferase family protein [Paenibacillus castaneae]NIK76504.1 hypothetical protein [Paenibacillus castaneae]
MNLQLAENQVKEWAEANSYSLGLIRSKIEAKYIWNPGGFVNQSFRLSDGETIRHLKLVQERNAPRLKQWALLSNYLTNNYNAPRLIREVSQEIITGYCYGLVFEFIKGKPLSSFSNPAPVIEKVLHALSRLHKDKNIKTVMTSVPTKPTYSDAFIEEYINRFEEDLQVIRAEKHLLYFVTEDTLNWFESEIEELRKIVKETPSFQKKATDVVHNDLNWENVLANDNFDFWIIDWDSLAGEGDAAMDYSVLLWPLYHSEDWAHWKNRLIASAGEEVFERVAIYFRAKLLDDVIDVLADYVDAENVPEVKEMTQKRAKEIHLRAYSEYVSLYK